MNTSQGGALQGYKVVDLTRVLGGPFATQILADHGADVIKIEPPQGDEVRDWGPPFLGGMSSYFININRNKKTLAVDLSNQQSHEILFRLLKDADFLVENFKIGTMERWGLGYDQVLSKSFPRLIHCRITGFGNQGPYAGLAGYDAVAQSLTGLVDINGASDGPPVRVGVPLVDLGAGLHAVIGMLMAALYREKTGKGQSIEVSLYDVGLSFLHPQGINYLVSGLPQKRLGDAHPNISPYSQFQTKTCRIFIGCGNQRQFEFLCQTIGADDVFDDPRFQTNADRVIHRDDLRHALEKYLIHLDGEDLARQLLSKNIPAAAILPVDVVLNHDQTHANQMVVGVDGYPGIASPIHLSETSACYHLPPPEFAQHNLEILLELGYNQDEIQDLIHRGIVVQTRQGIKKSNV